MIIAIPKENREGESRVAASPEVVKKFIGLGFEVSIEKGAGSEAGFTDEQFEADVSEFYSEFYDIITSKHK